MCGCGTPTVHTLFQEDPRTPAGPSPAPAPHSTLASGFVWIRFHKVTVTEMAALERQLITHSSPKEGPFHVTQGHTG